MNAKQNALSDEEPHINLSRRTAVDAAWFRGGFFDALTMETENEIE